MTGQRRSILVATVLVCSMIAAGVGTVGASGSSEASGTAANATESFEVSNLTVSGPVIAGESVTANATVTNTGSSNATETVELALNGSVLASKDVRLAAGASETVSLSATTGGLTPGEYTVELRAGNSTETADLTVGDATVEVLKPYFCDFNCGGITVGYGEQLWVQLENSTADVAGYNLTVELTNETVAEIVDAEVDESVSEDVRIDNDGTAVTATADFNGSTDVDSLVEITIQARAIGTTDVVVNRSSEIRKADNESYVIGGFESYSFTVSAENGTNTSTLPINVDGDPLLEDMDRDGTANVFDAIALYNRRNEPLIQNNPQFFDFDGDGKVDVFDAIALYNEVS